MAAGKLFRENSLQGLTPLVSKVNKLLVSLDIGQHNAMESFTVKLNVVSETSKVFLNDTFTELDGSSEIKNIITDRLNLGVGELQVDDISAKIRYGRKYKEIYTNQVNQALSGCFFSIFSENCGRGISTVFRLSIMHVVVAAGFNEFHFIFKEQNSSRIIYKKYRVYKEISEN